MLLSVCAVLCAGVPLTIVHSHADATVGHVHDLGTRQHAVEHEHDDHHANEELDTSSFHVHALDIPLPGITASPQLSISQQLPQSLTQLPADNWLPDKPVSPLYRPPIA